MLNRESDLKYILGFKIINECSILLENYCLETQSNYPKNKKIIEQCKELQDVLSFIIEKNTNRIDDNLFEIYQKDGKQNKRVTFLESKFVTIIEVESYKKYNEINACKDPYEKFYKNNDTGNNCCLGNDKVNCSCLIV
jgi:hypothetical protein